MQLLMSAKANIALFICNSTKLGWLCIGRRIIPDTLMDTYFDCINQKAHMHSNYQSCDKIQYKVSMLKIKAEIQVLITGVGPDVAYNF